MFQKLFHHPIDVLSLEDMQAFRCEVEDFFIQVLKLRWHTIYKTGREKNMRIIK